MTKVKTCPVCGKPSGIKAVETLGVSLEVAVRCDCELRDLAARDDALRQAPTRAGITGLPAAYAGAEFPAADDSATRVCRAYASAWESMAASGQGLTLWGPVGTGKTFLAACIARFVSSEYGASVLCLPASHAADLAMQPTLQRLWQYDLVILDDVGAEADTAYRQSVIYRVIDDRTAADRPLIVTTNLNYDTQCACIDGAYGINAQRAWDRLYAKNPAVQVTGVNHRGEIAVATSEAFGRLLKGGQTA